MTRAWMILVVAALLLGAAGPAPADMKGRLGAQYRYGFFSDHNDLRDGLVYWAARQYHVQLEYWDFVNPGTDDQFRPELGLHLRDRRKSSYTVQWRHERKQERLWFGTDQVLSDHWVGRVEVSPIIATDTTLWVYSTGADYYWRSWNFASVTVIRDPRQDGLWIVPMRLRIANEANDWVQATFAPASEQSVGWALDVKKRWVRLGVERNNRYDFTNVDNTFVTVGVEFDLPREP
ncbi:MAG TPA: hypothetical protein VJY35_01145 [Candidatus Eisenbacteria bacterium]|nr:hypothetical protein [Candidatus Eisenbacteria bacterium]